MRIDGAGVIDDLLTWIVQKLLRRRKPEGSLRFSFGVPGAITVTVDRFYTDLERKLLMAQLSIDQIGTARIAPKDRLGNPALLDGAPSWSIDRADLANIVASEDGLTCGLSPTGALGTLTLSVSADADLGEGVVNLVGSAEVEIIAGQAVSLELAIDLSPAADVPVSG